MWYIFYNRWFPPIGGFMSKKEAIAFHKSSDNKECIYKPIYFESNMPEGAVVYNAKHDSRIKKLLIKLAKAGTPRPDSPEFETWCAVHRNNPKYSKLVAEVDAVDPQGSEVIS